ncbi:hypothetical protein [Paraglaciecola psychrophila]|uniref:hypothetical protein n=1 Tax=Paraglaciecola psychrophila TaxID=326544 RepID=UPI003898F79C
MIGLGAIGSLVADMALALGMNVVGFTLRFQLKRLGVCLATYKKLKTCTPCSPVVIMSVCTYPPSNRPII